MKGLSSEAKYKRGVSDPAPEFYFQAHLDPFKNIDATLSVKGWLTESIIKH
ncbi:MAG: hypothetical protein QXN85_02395 [Candidatus Bathyarchaeia archaeon]